MRILADLGAEEILVYLDSKLIVQQVLGTYDKRKEHMIRYHEQVENLKKKFHKVSVIQIS